MKREHFIQLLNEFSPAAIVEGLDPFILKGRKDKIRQVMRQRLSSIEIAFEAPSDIHNALASLRSAEACGIAKAHLIAAQIKGRLGRRSTAGASHWLEIQTHKDFSQFEPQRRDLLLAAATLEGTLSLDDLPIDRPICLLFGNEHQGLSHQALESADFKFKIPMYGMVQSYNLSVSAAIALFAMTQRRRAYLKGECDLSSDELLRACAYGYAHSVGCVKAHRILLNLKQRAS